MRIVVDPNRCVGTGICESIADDVFEVTGGGTLKLRKDVVAETDRDRMEQAVARCPTEALKIEG
jgi:ferredoxin